MKKWMKRIRGALGMGLCWAVGWALTGVLIGLASNLFPRLPWNAFFEVFDAPLPALAIPGFVAGALFSIVLGIAARRRSFEDLSLFRVTTWGAIGGLLLSFVPATMVGLGVLTGDTPHGLWRLTAVIAGPFTLLSALSAAGSLLLARNALDEPLVAVPDAAKTQLREPSTLMPLASSEQSVRAARLTRDQERSRPGM